MQKLGNNNNFSLPDTRKTREKVKIYTTQGIAFSWLPAQLKLFWSLYPDVEITVQTSQKPLKLSQGEIQIRGNFFPQENLEKVQVLDFNRSFFASISYIKKYGKPESIDDLSGHKLLFSIEEMALKGTPGQALMADTRLISDDFVLSLSLCQMGEGILSAPEPLTETHNLEKILEKETPENKTVYVGYLNEGECSTAKKFIKTIQENNSLLSSKKEIIRKQASDQK